MTLMVISPRLNDKLAILSISPKVAAGPGVAGIIAEILFPTDRDPGGVLSVLYDKLKSGDTASSDFIDADAKAVRLIRVRRGIENPPLDVRKDFLAQAEGEAEQILQSNGEALIKLADALMAGPVTGTVARQILGM